MKFAHLADCHIGAWRDPKLKELNLFAFMQALDKCVEENVNFIVITGDLFDTTMPDLTLVKQAVAKIRAVRDLGIAVYLTYGSHDFAANSVSIIDILNSAGLFKKVVETEFDGEIIKLKFIPDKQTGVKLAGLSGRRLGLERNYFPMLDLRSLEEEKGFKVFVFHNAITEVRSISPYSEGVPISSFPKGFDYYAGGHVHETSSIEIQDYGIVAFPGCLFGAKQTDLELTAQGTKRGFFIVTFNQKVEEVEFIEINVKDVLFQEFNVEGKTANQVGNILSIFANETDFVEKIVLLKVVGVLSSGKPSDINFNELKQLLLARGAYVAEINRSSFKSSEEIKGNVQSGNKPEIEINTLTEYIHTYKIDPTLNKELKEKLEKTLLNEDGVALAKTLLTSLRLEKNDDENKRDFEQRVLQNTVKLLNLEGEAE